MNISFMSTLRWLSKKSQSRQRNRLVLAEGANPPVKVHSSNCEVIAVTGRELGKGT